MKQNTQMMLGLSLAGLILVGAYAYSTTKDSHSLTEPSIFQNEPISQNTSVNTNPSETPAPQVQNPVVKAIPITDATPTSVTNAGAQKESGDTVPTTSTDHATSYLSAFISTLGKIYASTQELSTVSAQYPTNGQMLNVMTAELQADSDFQIAIIDIHPYINDSDEAIGSSATLLYADILTLKNANTTVVNILRNATPETLNEQQANYAIAQVAAAQTSLQKDLMTNGLMLIICDAIIKSPTEDATTTGPINYSISPAQRQELLGDIQTTFGNNINNYNNNVYLQATKLVQLNLQFDTYEELKNALASI